jgi:hypothetical protein
MNSSIAKVSMQLTGLLLLLGASSGARAAPDDPDRRAAAAAAAGIAADRIGEPAFSPKLTAPIGISYEFGSTPAVGQALDIDLAVTALTDLANAVVSLSAADGLIVVSPNAAAPLGTLAAGESKSLRLTVLPLEASTYHFGISVTGTIGGREQTRSLSIPIRLQPASPAKSSAEASGKAGGVPQPGAAGTGNAGAGVRSFEAVETVR